MRWDGARIYNIINEFKQISVLDKIGHSHNVKKHITERSVKKL